MVHPQELSWRKRIDNRLLCAAILAGFGRRAGQVFVTRIEGPLDAAAEVSRLPGGRRQKRIPFTTFPALGMYPCILRYATCRHFGNSHLDVLAKGGRTRRPTGRLRMATDTNRELWHHPGSRREFLFVVGCRPTRKSSDTTYVGGSHFDQDAFRRAPVLTHGLFGGSTMTVFSIQIRAACWARPFPCVTRPETADEIGDRRFGSLHVEAQSVSSILFTPMADLIPSRPAWHHMSTAHVPESIWRSRTG